MSAVPQPVSFDAPDLLTSLRDMDDAALDACSFGVIAMDAAGTVVQYNAFEERRAGMSRERVVGRHFFSEVAPCTNNYLVATRYEDEPTLDAVIPYVFTLRMRPTPVELRMLRAPHESRMYLLVRPRGG